jgi:hypothetical protein
VIEAELSGKKVDETSSKQWMVTNRLNPIWGWTQEIRNFQDGENGESVGEQVSEKLAPGPITWAPLRVSRQDGVFTQPLSWNYGASVRAFYRFDDPFLCLAIYTAPARPGRQDEDEDARATYAGCGSLLCTRKEDALADFWDRTLQFESELKWRRRIKCGRT